MRLRQFLLPLFLSLTLFTGQDSIAQRTGFFFSTVASDSGPTAAEIADDFVVRVGADGGVVEAEECLANKIQVLMDAGIYEDASFVLLPSGYKEDKLYSIKPTDGNGDFVFSRNGTRTRKGETYIEEVPYNLADRSEEFNQATDWVVDGTTTSANQSIAPNGTITADAILETAGSSRHAIRTILTKSPVAIQYTMQVYLKPNGRNWCWVGGGDNSAQFVGYYFNLTTGAVGVNTVSSGSGEVLNSYTIEPADDGFYFISVTFTSDTGTIATGYFGTATADGTFSYAGDVTKGLYAWGGQLVQGAGRDYFKTTDRFNVSAIDYTNDTCPALSLEPARTNLIDRSEELDNAEWGKTSVTVAANNTLAPDGTMTADRLTATSADSKITNTSFLSGSIVDYSASVWVRGNAPGSVRLNFNNPSSSINLDYTTEWQRFTLTYTSNGGGTSAFVLGSNSTFTTGEIIYVWGAQLEVGSYATSYIPTTTGTVSRVADAVSSLTGISDLIGQTDGSLYIRGNMFADGVAKQISISDGTTGNRAVLKLDPGNTFTYQFFNNSVLQASITSGLYTTGTEYEIVIIYEPNYAALFVNGAKIGQDLSVTVPPFSRISLDNGAGGGNPFYGNLEALVLLPTSLTDIEAIALTTP